MSRKLVFDLVLTALTALSRHKIRSGLSVMGIVFGVAAVQTILAVGEGAERETLRRFEQMGMRNIFISSHDSVPGTQATGLAGDCSVVSYADMARLQNANNAINNIAASRRPDARIVTDVPVRASFSLLEVTPGYADLLGLKTIEGRFIKEMDLEYHNDVCVLGWNVATELGIEGKVGSTVRIGDGIVQIVGVLTNQNYLESNETKLTLHDINNAIFLPFGMSGSENAEGAWVDELILETVSIDTVQDAAAIARRTLSASHDCDVHASFIIPVELLAQARRIQRMFNLVFGIVGSLSLLVGGIGVMNIMLANIMERIDEIGIRRAVGATRRHIMLHYLLESVLLTTAGGCIGIAFGIGLAFFIELVAGWPIGFSFATIVLPLFVSVVVGVFFGSYPAVQAARMDIVKALGHSL